MGSGAQRKGQRKDEDRETSARDAALYDPDSVFHDHTAQTTADRAIGALTASGDEPAADETPAAPESVGTSNLYARNERKRSGALTKEMIKRIADRAEQAARNKK